MGFFNLLSDLLDEHSDNSLEKKLVGAIDEVEATLNTTLDKAEGGISKASNAVDTLNNVSTRVEETVAAASDKARQTIEIVEKKS